VRLVKGVPFVALSCLLLAACGIAFGDGDSREISGTVTEVGEPDCRLPPGITMTISMVPADPELAIRAPVALSGPCEGTFELSVDSGTEYSVCVDRIAEDPNAVDVVSRGTCGDVVPDGALADGHLDITIGDGVTYR